jgi:diguanylate cyclase (GGDEF)-like protein/PAS domain S-box-containing protein
MTPGVSSGLRPSPLPALESRVAGVFDVLREGVVVHDRAGNLIAANEGAARLLGDDPQDAPLLNEATSPTRLALATGEAVREVLQRIERPDGSGVWVSVSAEPVRASADADAWGVATTLTDVTRDHQSERALREERDRAQRYLDVAGAIIVVLDAEGVITLVNRAGCTVLGQVEGDLVGEEWFETVVPDEDRPAARLRFFERIRGRDEAPGDFDHALVSVAGERRTVHWHSTVLRDADDRITGLLLAGEDITESRRHEQQIAHLAYHDVLTGLPNRTMLEEHLRLAMARSRRTGHGIALLHLDVDNFRLVNDSLGHAVGDQVLGRVTARVRESTRATDLLARPGGDELLLLLADLEEEPIEVAQRVAEQIAVALQDPFRLGGAEFQIRVSIGIAAHPRDAFDAEELLNHADSAMYRAKAVARGGCAVYTDDTVDPLERLSMSARLRRALAAGDLVLHYQPIWDLATERVVSVEALLRWNDPEREELVQPGDFIPLAEETGLIEPIGDWVAGEACEQQVRWAALGLFPRITFNVSPRQLRRLDFAQRMGEHLCRTGADPAKLVVELTESATLQDPEETEPILRALHDLGLGLALDDFGSGYSSLSRLRELPVGTLKIDRSFLAEVPESREAAAVITAILHLGRALGRSIIAEGVETEAQRDFLLGEGCELVQGFLFARPMPADEVADLMARPHAATELI